MDQTTEGYELQDLNSPPVEREEIEGNPFTNREPSAFEEYRTKNPKSKIIGLVNFIEKLEQGNSSKTATTYALCSMFCFAFIGVFKVFLFPHIAFINFIFMQSVITLMTTYLICRHLYIKPFLLNPTKQLSLKIRGFLFLAGGLVYLQSWNYWSRNYSHMVLSIIPFVAYTYEIITGAASFNKFELSSFVLAFIGINLILMNSDPDAVFNYKGLGFAGLAAILVLFGFKKMENSSGNTVSMAFVFVFILDIFVPAFFAIQHGVPPGFGEVFIMLALGLIFTLGVVAGIRSTQLMKGSNTLVFGSLSLAVVFYCQEVRRTGLISQGFLGILIAILSTVILRVKAGDWNKQKNNNGEIQTPLV